VVPSIESEYIGEFWDKMKRAMAVSFYKYGPVADAYPDKVDAIASLRQRLREYERSGNTELLVDVANFAMIEFMHPRHSEAHYAPGDSDASPGRTTVGGNVTASRNDDLH
jgi:hypothetical protein